MKLRLLVATVGLLVGCSNGETNDLPTDEPEAGPSAEGCDGRGEPLTGLRVSTESDAGAKVTLSFIEGEPMPPVVGNNSWSFRADVDGEPLTGAAAAMTVTPFMPDHGHGTPTAVSVTEEEVGIYRFEPVHTRMAGYWEIRVDVEMEAATAQLLFGVCVD